MRKNSPIPDGYIFNKHFNLTLRDFRVFPWPKQVQHMNKY
jgi:hypothetical protein